MTVTRSSNSNRPETESDATACRRQALSALARREHSRMELERRLGRHGFANDVVSATLDHLEAAGMLDADRFCEALIRTRIGRGQGPTRIEHELAQHGIEAGHIRGLLAAADDWFARARAVRRRKFGDDVPKTYKERARQSRFLQYRGFSSEQIRAALQRDPDT